MKTCKVCGEQKRRSEMGHNDTCLNCIEKSWNEYYQKKSKEELISMCKSEKNKSDKSMHYLFAGVFGIVVVFLFIKHVSNPGMLEDLSFFETVKEIFGRVITALSYCFLAGIPAVLGYVVYGFVLEKFYNSKIPKIVIALLLCFAAFLLYVCYIAF